MKKQIIVKPKPTDILHLIQIQLAAKQYIIVIHGTAQPEIITIFPN